MIPPGAPYKYEKIIKTHNRFVQDVRFAPSGGLFASVGSDARVFLYDGKTGDTKADLGEGVHNGTIVCLNCEFFFTALLNNSPSLRSHGAPIVAISQPHLPIAHCSCVSTTSLMTSTNQMASISADLDPPSSSSRCRHTEIRVILDCGS